MQDEEHTGSESSESPTEPTSDAQGGMAQDLSAAVSKLGAGEKLAVLGAAGVLAVWLVFDLLIDEYSTGSVSFVLALVVSYAAYRHHGRGSEGWAVPYETIVWVGASLLGVLGVWFLIEELRQSILDADAATLIGALAFYVTTIVSGIGAFQLSSKR